MNGKHLKISAEHFGRHVFIGGELPMNNGGTLSRSEAYIYHQSVVNTDAAFIFFWLARKPNFLTTVRGTPCPETMVPRTPAG